MAQKNHQPRRRYEIVDKHQTIEYEYPPEVIARSEAVKPNPALLRALERERREIARKIRKGRRPA